MAILNGQVKVLLTKGVFAIGAGLFVEFIVDFFELPILSEKGLFGSFGSNKYSNYEVVVYALSAAGTAAGAMDYFSGSKPLGFTKEFMPYFLGYGMGTALYEHIVAPHLKGFNPYETVYKAIPSVPLV